MIPYSNTRERFLELIKLSLSILFVYAGFIKLLDTELFITQMNQSPLLPSALTGSIAYFLPSLEIIIGLSLWLPPSVRVGLYAAFFTMLMFSIYLLTLVTLYDNVPCACGGILGGMGYTVHIIFNIAFTLVALIGLQLESKIAEANA